MSSVTVWERLFGEEFVFIQLHIFSGWQKEQMQITSTSVLKIAFPIQRDKNILYLFFSSTNQLNNEII